MRVPLRYRLRGELDWRHATTLDISQSGILIFGMMSPEVGDEIDLRVGLGVAGLPLACQLSARATVVRRIDAALTESVVGAKFQEYRLLPVAFE